LTTEGSLSAQKANRKWTWPVTDPIYFYYTKRYVEAPFALLHL
jgi:hypothetical protein